MGKDHLQARIHVFEPGLDLGLGQLGFGQAGGLRGGGGFGRSGIQDGFGQAPALGLGLGGRRLAPPYASGARRTWREG